MSLFRLCKRYIFDAILVFIHNMLAHVFLFITMVLCFVFNRVHLIKIFGIDEIDCHKLHISSLYFSVLIKRWIDVAFIRKFFTILNHQSVTLIIMVMTFIIIMMNFIRKVYQNHERSFEPTINFKNATRTGCVIRNIFTLTSTNHYTISSQKP